MRQGDLNQSLIKAVYNRDVKQVKDVLDLGADVNATDDFGITALGQIYAYRGWHWYYSYTYHNCCLGYWELFSNKNCH